MQNQKGRRRRPLRERDYLVQAGMELGAAAAAKHLASLDISERTGLSQTYIQGIFGGTTEGGPDALKQIAKKGLECDLETALAQGREALKRLESRRSFPTVIKSYRVNNGLNCNEMGAILFPGVRYSATSLYKLESGQRTPKDLTVFSLLDRLGYKTVAQLEEAALRSTQENRDPKLARRLEALKRNKRELFADAEVARRSQKAEGEMEGPGA